MAITFQIKISGTWTTFNTYVLPSEIEINTLNIVDEVKINVNNTMQAALIILANGQEIRVLNGSTSIFSGTIYNIERVGNVTRKLIVKSYSAQFLQVNVNEYYSNVSPEYILNDMLQKYTDLTYASTITSGVTLEELTIKDKKLIDVINDLCDILIWQVRVDYNKNIYFEERGVQDTGLTLTVGQEIVSVPTWTKNTDNVINRITFEGDNQTFNTSESFNGTGAQTIFTLTYKPENVEVYISSVKQNPEITGAIIGGNYSLNKDEKTITFNAASIPAVGTDNVVVNYTYLVPIRIETQSSPLLTADEIRWKKIENKSIKTFADARKYIAQIFQKCGVPATQSSNVTLQTWSESIVGNSKATFVDVKSGINEELVIYKIKFKYPSPSVKLVVGRCGTDFFSYQKDLLEKIKELQAKLSSQDIIQKYFNVFESVKVNVSNVENVRYRYINDTPIACKLSNPHENSIARTLDKLIIIDKCEGYGNWISA